MRDQIRENPRFNGWFAVFAIVGVLAVQFLWRDMQGVEALPYSQFQRLLEQGQVVDVAISENTIQGTLKDALPSGNRQFRTTRVDLELVDELKIRGVEFRGEIESTLLRDLLSWILPAAIFVGIWLFALRRLAEKQGLGGGFMTIGRSKAKIYRETETGVSFADVAGVDEAKAELQEVVTFLKNPQHYGRLGARVPKGILLVGPPGTGKTLLARAVAGEAEVPFYSINGSEFVEMFVGVGAARVRDLFEQARQSAPAIIFIDELDALGRARGIYPGLGGHDEKEQTLNQLLAELDGFDPSAGLVLLAATNRPEILDPALLRAGRFDRQVLVDRPDRDGRLAILEVHARKIKLATEVDLAGVAAMTPGFSGADLANLVNEAALAATRRGAARVATEDFTVALERIVAGLEKRNRLLNPGERRIVAYHEMGHALVALALPGTDRIHKVSIIPRGIGSLGYTIQRPTEDRFLMTQEELENKMSVLLAGRAAELLVYDRISTGAADDLARATDIARSMALRYGMAPTLGPVGLEVERAPLLGLATAVPVSQRTYSEETAREIDCAVREIVTAALARAGEILARYRTELEAGAQALLERETLSEDELPKIVRPPLDIGVPAHLVPERKGV